MTEQTREYIKEYFGNWREGLKFPETKEYLITRARLTDRVFFNYFFSQYPERLFEFFKQDYIDAVGYSDLEISKLEIDRFSFPQYVLSFMTIQKDKPLRVYFFPCQSEYLSGILIREIEILEAKRGDNIPIEINVLRCYPYICSTYDIYEEDIRFSVLNPEKKITTYFHDLIDDGEFYRDPEEPYYQFIHDMNISNPEEIWSGPLKKSFRQIKTSPEEKERLGEYLLSQNRKIIDFFEERIKRVFDFMVLLGLNYESREFLKNTLLKNQGTFTENQQYLQERIVGYTSAVEFIKEIPAVLQPVWDFAKSGDEKELFDNLVNVCLNNPGLLETLDVPLSKNLVLKDVYRIVKQASRKETALQQEVLDYCTRYPVKAHYIKRFFMPYDEIRDIQENSFTNTKIDNL